MWWWRSGSLSRSILRPSSGTFHIGGDGGRVGARAIVMSWCWDFYWHKSSPSTELEAPVRDRAESKKSGAFKRTKS